MRRNNDAMKLAQEINFNPVKKYDIRVPADRAEIKNFEAECRRLPRQANFNLYGRPFKDQTKYQGFVINELMGFAHWSVIQYGMNIRVIRKKYGGEWCITLESVDGKPSIRKYVEYENKVKALQELYLLRSEAETKERKALEKTAALNEPSGEIPLELPDFDILK